MKKFEYLTESPTIDDGKIIDGYSLKKEIVQPIFGKAKIKEDITADYIDEEAYLNKKGEEGWELVAVIKNSLSYDLRNYYFKREL